MSSLVEMRTLRSGLERPLMKPLDEAVWQTWVAKGYAREKRRSAARVRFASWISIAGLLIVAGMWSHVTPYETAVRVVVATGALVVMVGACNARKYALPPFP